MVLSIWFGDLEEWSKSDKTLVIGVIINIYVTKKWHHAFTQNIWNPLCSVSISKLMCQLVSSKVSAVSTYVQATLTDFTIFSIISAQISPYKIIFNYNPTNTFVKIYLFIILVRFSLKPICIKWRWPIDISQAPRLEAGNVGLSNTPPQQMLPKPSETTR